MAIQGSVHRKRTHAHQFTEVSFTLNTPHTIKIELIGGLFKTDFIVWVDDREVYRKILYPFLVQRMRHSFSIENINCSIKYFWASGIWRGNIYADGKTIECGDMNNKQIYLPSYGKPSIVIGITVIIGWIALALMMFISLRGEHGNLTPNMALVLGLFGLSMILLNLLGFILGVITVFKTNKKKTSAVIGIVLNSLVVCFIVLVYLLDYLANR